MTDPGTDTATDTAKAALWVLIAFAGLVAAITFVLSFAGLDDYGRTVAGEGHLSALVPLGVDGLTLVGVVATYMLRTAPWHVRAYAWGVFAIALGASIAGNLSHALAHHLSRQGQVGAAAWPVFLALASHVVIVVRRRQEPRRIPAAVTDAVVDTETVDADERATRRLTPEAYAIQQARRGWSTGRIQKALAERGDEVHTRTVARWTEEVRRPKTTDIAPTPAEVPA